MDTTQDIKLSEHKETHSSRMFPFITKTWNPLGGKCAHDCSYCWAKNLINRHKMAKYQGTPRIDESRINERFKKGSFIFVQDMSDLFAENVPESCILRVLDNIKKNPDSQFLLLTKNPKRYEGFKLPTNIVAGATIESELDPRLYGTVVNHAPMELDRLWAMSRLQHPRKFVSIEPILDFSLGHFIELLKYVQPEFVAVGYDNYNNNLPEPELSKTVELIEELEKFTKVYRKTLREAHGDE